MATDRAAALPRRLAWCAPLAAFLAGCAAMAWALVPGVHSGWFWLGFALTEAGVAPLLIIGMRRLGRTRFVAGDLAIGERKAASSS